MSYTKVHENIQALLKDKAYAFETDTDADVLWELYLNSFPEGTNNIFRQRRIHDCSACRNFIRKIGNLVVIDDKYQLISIFDKLPDDHEYSAVFKALSDYVKSKPIKNIYLSEQKKVGIKENYERTVDNSILTWTHFYTALPDRFVHSSKKESIEAIKGSVRDTKNVFHRSLTELSADSVETVLDLISQKSLYKGDEWETVLKQFRALQIEYMNIRPESMDNWLWVKSTELSLAVLKIRNHSIGTLLIDLSAGMDIESAVRKYEVIVAPTNYKRPKAIFTKNMLDAAQKKIEELGLLPSLQRKFANIDDITINNIIYGNANLRKAPGQTPSVFEQLQADAKQPPKNFDRVEEMPIADFVENVLPRLTGLEVLFDPIHRTNLVSLIAPVNKDSASLFKWNNGFSWAYPGNVTDSIKQNVQKAGGNVGGVLRFSIQWNENQDNNDDYDAHAIEPDGNHIYFGARQNIMGTTGELDIDILRPFAQCPDRPAVENITWTDKNKMLEGTYHFYVHNYCARGIAKAGFSAQIEYDGQIFDFDYPYPLRFRESVTVAKIEFSRKTGMKIQQSLKATNTSVPVWNINTNQFIPVNAVMYSPNYWAGEPGTGNKHVFFMLQDCLNPDTPSGFFNEFLKEDLMPHKHVFEALSSKMRVHASDNQLSGLGFSTTQRNVLVVKVSGHINRVLKLLF